jgi:hypothetical protein
LTTNDDDLGKVDGVVDADSGEDILELVDQPSRVMLAVAQTVDVVLGIEDGRDEGRVRNAPLCCE